MLIFELEVPLLSNCRVLVRLMVPLMVIMSPALAALTAAFNAASVVTVVDVMSDLIIGSVGWSLGEVAVGFSVFFWQAANRMASTATLMKLFIKWQLMVKK